MNKSLKELFKNVETHPQEEFDWGEQEYIARLEKALDKACEKLALICKEINICKLEYCPLEHPKFGCSKCDNARYWKEWALKEVQEDD